MAHVAEFVTHLIFKISRVNFLTAATCQLLTQNFYGIKAQIVKL